MRRSAAPPASPGMVERLAGLWSAVAGVMLVWSMLRPYLPHQLLDNFAGRFLRRHAPRLAALLDPCLTVTVAEYDGEKMKRGEVYEQAKAYPRHRCAGRARKIRAEPGRTKRDPFVLSLGDNEEVPDEFGGATVWSHSVPASSRQYHGWHRGGGGDMFPEDTGRAYRLVFHQRHRDLVVGSYLPHVCSVGRALMATTRRRKLYTNAGDRYSGSMWKHVVFEHPSTFDTLAMDPAKKREIMDDLDEFRNGKDCYKLIGKAWKRGYLLYGPPGTGKSTMIAAMANYLDYDIYDIELTSVSTNADLRRMLTDTGRKSITVIEDIDCSLDLTGTRHGGRTKKKGGRPAEDGADDKKEQPAAAGDEQGDSVRPAQLHRRPLVGVRRRAHHRVHDEPRGAAGPGAGPARPHGQAHRDVLLLLRVLQAAGPELPRRGRAPAVRRREGAAAGGRHHPRRRRRAAHAQARR